MCGAADQTGICTAKPEACTEDCPGACGCAAQGTNLEDGSWIDFTDTNYAVECSAGQCGSVYSGVKFACANTVCTQTQYCQIVIGGPAGSEPSGNCLSRGICNDCTCVNPVGCECTDTNGNITVTCAAP